jgi:di/tricarboxylate transporter
LTVEIAILLAVVLAMAVLFFTEKLPIELTAFLGLVVLTLGGYVTPAEAFTGFASPAVITMLSIFFVSAALLHTGVADMIGGRVHRLIGDRERLLVVAIMVVAGVLSAFMNNVAAVAVLLPAVASIARRTGIAASRLFMPLSFGAILGGTMTMVGTPPNILAADLLRERGLEPFGLFEFTPVGSILLAVGVLYMITFGRWLLPQRILDASGGGSVDLTRVYDLTASLVGIRIPHDSSLVGRTLGEARLGSTLHAQVVGIVRDGQRTLAPGADTVVRGDDELIVEGQLDEVRELFGGHGIELGDPTPDFLAEAWGDIGCHALSVDETSPLLGQTLRDTRFRERYGSIVIGIRRADEILDSDLAEQTIRAGDELLAVGTRKQLDAMDLPDGVTSRNVDPASTPDLYGHLFLLGVHAGSPLVGTRLRNSHIKELAGLTVVGVGRNGDAIRTAGPDTRFRTGDQLLVAGDPDRVRTLLELGNAQLRQDISRAGFESDDVGMVEVTLSPRSRVEGRTLAEIDFREQHGLQALAIWRMGAPIKDDLAQQKLRFGDALLVQGSYNRIRLLGAHSDYVVLSASAQEPRRTTKAPVAIGCLGVMIAMVVTGFQPIHVAAFTAATLVVLLGAIKMEEAYHAVEWKAVFLVAAILPMGLALEKTGAAMLAADMVSATTGPYGPHAAMAGLFTMSSVLSQCLDGAPAVVMMTPVVLEAAGSLGIDSRTLMMGVALAASAAFMTPFSHKANLLVMGSGGYKTTDYLRVGTPLTIVLLILMVVLVPVFFPIAG